MVEEVLSMNFSRDKTLKTKLNHIFIYDSPYEELRIDPLVFDTEIKGKLLKMGYVLQKTNLVTPSYNLRKNEMADNVEITNWLVKGIKYDKKSSIWTATNNLLLILVGILLIFFSLAGLYYAFDFYGIFISTIVIGGIFVYYGKKTSVLAISKAKVKDITVNIEHKGIITQVQNELHINNEQLSYYTNHCLIKTIYTMEFKINNEENLRKEELDVLKTEHETIVDFIDNLRKMHSINIVN